MRDDVIGFVILGLVFGLFFVVDVGAVTLTCAFDVNAECSSNTTLFYVQNDSGGYENSHAQNLSEASYDNSVCCSVDTGTLGTSCDQGHVLDLSNESNAHVQASNYTDGTDYEIPVCLSYTGGNVSCSYVPGGSCGGSGVCVASIASSESGDGNVTNSHVGSCGYYDMQVCCSISAVPVVTLSNPGNGVEYEASSQSITFQYSVTNSSAISNCSLYVDGSVENDSVAAGYDVDATEVNEFVNTFSATGVAKNWNVHCIDGNDDVGIGTNRTFTITEATTTDSGSSSSSSSGGGGGGGGGGGSSGSSGASITPTLTIIPDDLSIDTIIDVSTSRKIIVRNNKGNAYDFSVSIDGLEGVLSTVESFTLGPNSEEELTLNVEPIREGLQTGKILLTSATLRDEIPVILNVRSNDFLFDAVVKVQEEDRQINVGDDLNVQVELDQVGPREKVDVFVTYVIKDFDGNVYLEDSETFFVLGEKDFVKDFAIGSLGLPLGKYVIGMEIAYPGAFATSSAQFEIKEDILGSVGLSPLIIGAIIAGVAGIGAIIWAVFRRGGRAPKMKRRKL